MKKRRKGAAIVISIYNEKGGCGKTTTCLAIAHLLAKQKYKTLLIDNDPQRNSAVAILNPEDNIHPGITEVLLKDKPITDVIYQSKFQEIPLYGTPFRAENLEYFESDYSISDLHSRESTLKLALLPIKNDFDFIILDCPGNFNINTYCAFVASDYYIIPSEGEMSNLDGMLALEERLKKIRAYLNPNIKFSGMLLTRYRNTSVTNDFIDNAKTVLQDNFFPVYISLSKFVPESAGELQPVTVFEPECKPSLEYKKLVDIILKRIGR